MGLNKSRGRGGAHDFGVLLDGLAAALLADLGLLLQQDGPLGARAAQRLKERHIGRVLGLLVKLEVDHGLGELAEGRRRVAAQQVRARRHLLLAHQEALVVALHTIDDRHVRQLVCPTQRSSSLAKTRDSHTHSYIPYI